MELADIHGWTGYVVFVVVIAAAVMAFNRAKNAQEFEDTPFKVAVILLDLQVALGLVVYGVGQYWNGDAPLIQYVHPVIMLLALGLAHAGLGGARKEQMAADAHRKVGRMLLVAVVLLIAGIGVASAA